MLSTGAGKNFDSETNNEKYVAKKPRNFLKIFSLTLTAAIFFAAACFSVLPNKSENLKRETANNTAPEWSSFYLSETSETRGLIEIVNGASIRLMEPTGIRFSMSVDADKFNALENKTLGMMLVPSSLLPSGVELTLENCDDYDATVVKTPELAYEKDGRYYYAVVMTNIPKESYSAELAVRGFITYANENGESITEYTDTVKRSASYVAKRLVEKDDGADAYLNLNSTGKRLIRNYSSLKALFYGGEVQYGDDSLFDNDTDSALSVSAKIAIYETASGFEIYATGAKIFYIGSSIFAKSGVLGYNVRFVCEAGSATSLGFEYGVTYVDVEENEVVGSSLPGEEYGYTFTFNKEGTVRIYFEAIK